MLVAQNGLWPGAVALLSFPRRGRGTGYDKQHELKYIIRLVTGSHD